MRRPLPRPPLPGQVTNVTNTIIKTISIINFSKRRLAELSHELSLAQKISLGCMWLLAAFFGVTACFPEKVGNNMI